MGNSSSKTPARKEAIELEHSKIKHDVAIAPVVDGPFDEDTPPLDVLLDPRSPHVARTPLAKILPQRLSEKPLRNELKANTPTNILRKRIMRDIGFNYTSKELNLLDPRSPSQFIPRTPLNLWSPDDFIGENSRGTSKVISLEYSGFIEEASCRNFNEKLANITLDDADYDFTPDSPAKDDEFRDGELAKIRRKYLETNFDFVGDEIKFHQVAELDPRSPSENIIRTPFALPSKPTTDVSAIDSISPIITAASGDGDGDEKDKYTLPMFSSTPTAQQTSGDRDAAVVKAKNLGKIIKTRIYEDEPETENISSRSIEAFLTPLKKFTKANADDDKPRTPLSIVNRRTKSAESLAQRQSRLRINNENAKNSCLTARTVENAGNENHTPRRPGLNVNRNQLSVRSSCSKIPIFKK